MASKNEICDLVLIWKYLMCCRCVAACESNTIFLFLDCTYKYEKI